MDMRRMEVEANTFAMELLMPEEWVRADLLALGGVDIEDRAAVKKLARKYKVSEAVMILRIGQINLETCDS